VPYDDEAFSAVARYFFALADVQDVRAYCRDGYVPVDATRLAANKT
jgi:hypothetical protein